MTVCSECRHATTWVRDTEGRSFMIDADPDPTGAVILTGRHVETRSGLVPQARELDHTLALFDDGKIRFTRHDLTCPGSVTVRPVTPESVEALEEIRPHGKRLRSLVYDLLVTGPRTDEQIADELDLSPNTARPRRVELVNDGLVKKVGTGLTRSSKKAALWGAVDGNGNVYA